MSTISAVKAFLATYAPLATGVLISTDFLGPDPVNYAIISLPGTKVVEWYLDGGSVREFPFAFQATFSTADEAERLENSGFYEGLSDWFEAQTNADTFPTLGTGQTPTKIEVLGWAFIYQQGSSSTGVYSVQCKLTYSQDA
jgi:hypothetical protein